MPALPLIAGRKRMAWPKTSGNAKFSFYGANRIWGASGSVEALGANIAATFARAQHLEAPSHCMTRIRGKRRIPGAFAIMAVLLPPAMFATMAPSVGATVIYKCTNGNDDQSVEYSSKLVKGAHCIKIVYADGNDSDFPKPAKSRSAAPALRPDTSSPAAFELPVGRQSGALVDFGEPNAARLRELIRSRKGLHYVQLGDSHTAGDFLTGELRVRLQSMFGDGGIGWSTPMRVPGQRLARVQFSAQGWSISSSRSSGPADYPVGGLIASPAPGARLTIASNRDEPMQTITTLIRQGPGDAPLVVSSADGSSVALRSPVLDGTWRRATFNAKLPITVTATNSPASAIGGWWFDSGNGEAQVSAIGINGSEQSQWSRWRAGWVDDLAPARPDIVAIAYGTNESLRRPFDTGLVQDSLDAGIAEIRSKFPGTTILVIGPPESLMNTAGACGIRTPELDRVQAIIRQSAQKGRALYWDWQQAMGGRCSMKRWMGDGLGRPDGVHFSSAGYMRIGDSLFNDLMGALGRE